MPYLILVAAILAFVVGFVAVRWREPRRQERRRALRALRDDRRWKRFGWPE